MTVSVPDPQPPAVPDPAMAAMLPPLPALFANLPPSAQGDQIRQHALFMWGVAASLDYYALCFPQKQCDVCNRFVDARVHADHVAAHGPIDRWLARKLGMRMR